MSFIIIQSLTHGTVNFVGKGTLWCRMQASERLDLWAKLSVIKLDSLSTLSIFASKFATTVLSANPLAHSLVAKSAD